MSEPRHIAMYVIERRLGSTGATESFKGRLHGGAADTPPVVIKRLQSRFATPENVKAFLDHARAAAWLDHPNIAAIYETDIDEEGVPFTVMEFVDGPTVAQIILRATETGELPLTRLVAMFVGAAKALDHAHHACSADGVSLGMVHGDVSTDNLRVGRDGVTKVLDFGQVRLGPTTKSKVRYTAPELLRDPSAKPGAAADVFGLGVCLYLASTGAWPFAGITDGQLKAAAIGGLYRKPSELIPRFPLKLEEAICGALEPEPYRRLDARAVAERLTAWLESTGEQMSDQELGEWIRLGFADRAHGTPLEPEAIGEPTPAAIVAVKPEPEEIFPFEVPAANPLPPPPSPPGVARPTPAPFAAPPPLPPPPPANVSRPTPAPVALAAPPPPADVFSRPTPAPVGLAAPPPPADVFSRPTPAPFSPPLVPYEGFPTPGPFADPTRVLSPAPLHDAARPTPLPFPAAGAIADPFASATTGDHTAVDVSISGITRMPEGAQPQPFDGPTEGDFTSTDVSLSDLGDQTVVRAVSEAELTGEGVPAAERQGLPAPDGLAPDPGAPAEDDGDPTGVLPGDGLPASLAQPPRGLGRTLALAAAIVVLLGGLGAGAATWKARRYRPPPPSEARLYIDTAQSAVLANNPTLTATMLDRARALPALTPREIIEVATLEDATRFARLLAEAEAALQAGDTRLAHAKLDQVEKALPNSPEAQALRRRVDGLPPAPEPTPAEAPPEPEATVAEAAPPDAGVIAEGELEALVVLAPEPGAPAKRPTAPKRRPPPAKANPKAPAGGTSAAEAPLVALATAPAPKAPPRLAVTSSVAAKLTLDGKALGHTPLAAATVEPGRHVLVATAEGYRPLTRELELEEGELETVALELEKLPPPPVAPTPAPTPTPAPAPREPSPDGPISRCPEETTLQGDAPPAGSALWCATASGVKHGRYIRWNANGKKAEEGEYVNGRKNGVWIEYFENGTERERTSWRRGVKAW